MANVFSTKKSVFFVGGAGLQNESSATNGGCTKDWYDANFTTLTDIMGFDGGALCNTILGTPSGGDTLTAGIGSFLYAEPGMVAYLSGTNVTNGRYEILTVPDNDTLTFPAGTFDGVTADISCYVGGAFDTLQNAMDNCPAADYDVYVLDNILVQTPGATLDPPTGSVANNSHFIDIGFHTTPPTNDEMDNGDMDYGGAYCQSAESALQDGVDTAGERCISIDGEIAERHILTIDGDDNQIFRNYYYHNAHQTAHDCVSFSATPVNVTFSNCKFDDAKTGLRGVVSGLFMNDCYVGNDFTDTYGSSVLTGFTGVWKNCIINGETNTYVFRDDFSSFEHCLFYGSIYGPTMLKAMNYTHCLFYGQTHCCGKLLSTVTSVGGDSNIFMPAAAADYVFYSSGAKGSVNSLYLTNNLIWTIAGVEVTNHLSLNGVNSQLANAIEADPLFADAANKDFRLKPGSPCLNTGKKTISDSYSSIGIYQRKQKGSRLGSI